MADAVYTVVKSEGQNATNSLVAKITNDSGTATDYFFETGFTPRYVKVHNITDQLTDEFFTGMTADHAVHTAANGTVTESSSNGFTVARYGITIAKEIAISAKVLYVLAIG